MKWATEKKLVRPLVSRSKSLFLLPARRCEYDENVVEYWVNTRTEGELKQQDLQQFSRKRSHDQEVSAEDALSGDGFSMDAGGFSGLGASDGNLELEGEGSKTVP